MKYIMSIVEENYSIIERSHSTRYEFNYHFDGLVQDCNISIVDTLEIFQSYAKPLIC